MASLEGGSEKQSWPSEWGQAWCDLKKNRDDGAHFYSLSWKTFIVKSKRSGFINNKKRELERSSNAGFFSSVYVNKTCPY